MGASGTGGAWQLSSEVFCLFLSPWNGIFRPDHRDQAGRAPISHDEISDGCDPQRSGFFDFAFDRKKALFFCSSLCGGVKWMMRAEEKRKTGRCWDGVAQLMYSK